MYLMSRESVATDSFFRDLVNLCLEKKNFYKSRNLLDVTSVVVSDYQSLETYKEPYKRDYILQKTPIQETILCKRDLYILCHESL